MPKPRIRSPWADVCRRCARDICCGQAKIKAGYRIPIKPGETAAIDAARRLKLLHTSERRALEVKAHAQGRCLALRGGHCALEEAKPRICREFPFGIDVVRKEPVVVGTCPAVEKAILKDPKLLVLVEKGSEFVIGADRDALLQIPHFKEAADAFAERGIPLPPRIILNVTTQKFRNHPKIRSRLQQIVAEFD